MTPRRTRPPGRPKNEPTTSIVPMTPNARAGYAASVTSAPEASARPRMPRASATSAKVMPNRSGPRLRDRAGGGGTGGYHGGGAGGAGGTAPGGKAPGGKAPGGKAPG